jgi:hypothetical protein
MDLRGQLQVPVSPLLVRVDHPLQLGDAAGDVVASTIKPVSFILSPSRNSPAVKHNRIESFARDGTLRVSSPRCAGCEHYPRH